MRAVLLIKSHLDVSTCLVSELGKHLELHVIFVVAGEVHQESSYDFNLAELPLGMTKSSEMVSTLLGDASKLFAQCKSVAFFKLPSWSMKSPANLGHAWKLAAHLRRLRPDVIHFNGSVGMFHPLYYLFTPGIAKVQSIHDSAPHSGEHNWKKVFLQRFGVRMADRVTLFSDYCRKNLLSIYPSLRLDTVDVIPLGPIPLAQEVGNLGSGTKRDPHHILFWGRISPYKGLDDLAVAFPLVREQFPQARLTIAGNGDLGANRDRFLSMDGVTVLNRYIPNAELLKLIESAAFGVLPYRDATQSGVVMVAFAHELPLIVTDVGGMSEVVEDKATGVIIPPYEPQVLAEAMTRLLGDEELRQEMSFNIKKMCAQRFGWGVVAKKFVEVYEKVCPETV